MSLVCPREDIRISGGAKVCVSCANGDDPSYDTEGYSRFHQALFGHFAGPKRVEALVYFEGCGPFPGIRLLDASDLSTYLESRA
jgi:hypothetical protein